MAKRAGPTAPPAEVSATSSPQGNEPEEKKALADRQREAGDYVAEVTGELAAIAKGCGLDLLGYLLDMARLEAESTARRLAGGSEAA